tara:strand:+ start:24807 stop:25028 length:222 start_codon:yes stop_codon:yes gene_type:complete
LKNLIKPSYIDRIYMWIMSSSKRGKRITQAALGEAYDLGYNKGLIESAAKFKGKKYAKKVSKLLKNKYGKEKV